VPQEDTVIYPKASWARVPSRLRQGDRQDYPQYPPLGPGNGAALQPGGPRGPQRVAAPEPRAEAQARGKFPEAFLGLPGCMPFRPPGGLCPLVPSCGVYVERPGNPQQHHARCPPPQALLGPFPVRRPTFSRIRGPAPPPDLPVLWKRRCYRGRS